MREFGNNLRQESTSRHPHDLEDWQRDLPQSLLFPHSLDTTAPGRQVLLRHQRVLFAMSPTVLEPNEDEEKGQCSPAGSKMSARVDRMRDRYGGFKQRVAPKQYPYAWLMFAVIILISAVATIVGWYGMAAETIHHHGLTSSPITASTTMEPAPPNLVVASAVAMTTTTSSLAVLPGFVAATMPESISTSPPRAVVEAPDVLRMDDIDSGPSAFMVLTDEYATDTKAARDAISVSVSVSVATVTVSVSVSVSVTVTADALPHPEPPHPHPHPTGSSSTSSSTLFTVNSTSSMQITKSVTSFMSSPKTSITASSTVSTTTDDFGYCLHSKQPKVWTPCPDGPTAGSNATAIAASAGGQGMQMKNPLFAARCAVTSLWKWHPVWEHLTTTRQPGNRNDDCDCDCDELARIVQLLREALQMQRRLLEDQVTLMQNQHRLLGRLRNATGNA